MVEKILSKAEGQPLPKFITLLTGVPLFVWALHKFGNISVKTHCFDFFVFDGSTTPQSFIIILLTIMTIHFGSKLLASTIIRKCLDKDTAKKKQKCLLNYFTIDDLLDVLSATAALLLSIILQNEGIKNDLIQYLAAIFIALNFRLCIYYHYDYENKKMISEHMKNLLN